MQILLLTRHTRSAYTFYYHDVPVQPPSRFPLPGTPGFPLTAYTGPSFASLCRFWLICYDVLLKYNIKGDQPIKERVSFSFVEDRYRMLLEWADNLPYAAWRHSQSPHYVLTMQ